MSERIIDQPEASVLSGDEYLIVDGSTNGTKKIAVGNILAKEVTIETGGEVTQELAPGAIYHFTGSVSVLNITLGQPFAVGPSMYRFDFYSGATSPTLVMPSDIVMPNNFMVEPNAKYELNIFNGYCVANKWADNHSPFVYRDLNDGSFVLNTSGFKKYDNNANIFANVGTEVIAISVNNIQLVNKLANATNLKLCSLSSEFKELVGKTYITSTIPLPGTGLSTYILFNTWENSSEITIRNSTGSELPANQELSGTFYILRTL